MELSSPLGALFKPKYLSREGIWPSPNFLASDGDVLSNQAQRIKPFSPRKNLRDLCLKQVSITGP